MFKADYTDTRITLYNKFKEIGEGLGNTFDKVHVKESIISIGV